MKEREIFIVLTDNDRLKKSDAIILLEGDGIYRVKKAAELLKQGYAPYIVISGNIYNLEYGSYPPSFLVPELERNGIGEKSIILEDRSQHTREQAIEILKLCKSQNWKRIILVASNFHQYRAYLTFLRVFIDDESEIEIINAPARDLTWFEKLPWGKRVDLLEQEFDKIEIYRQNNHIASFNEAINYQEWKETQI